MAVKLDVFNFWYDCLLLLLLLLLLLEAVGELVPR
jgi:hypothetical protein